MKIARALNRTIVGARQIVGRSSRVHVRRKGVNWALDLNEGIDLAIYLGRYQEIPSRVAERWIKPGVLALDIGANIGAFCLPLLGRVGPSGQVVAIEPTDFAFAKLNANAALNPALAKQLIAIQAALTDGTADNSGKQFFSRWPMQVDAEALHVEHMGQSESAHGAKFLALDDLLAGLRSAGRINGRVAFIKLDVDGHEGDVLAGGRNMFTADRPAVLVEIAPYGQDEVAGRFERLIGLFKDYGYALEDASSGRPMPMSADDLRRVIKPGAGVDALALPQ